MARKLIQIQLLLKLNEERLGFTGSEEGNSNTTLVKVKFQQQKIKEMKNHYSNTTLVKVKFSSIILALSYLSIQIQLLLKLNQLAYQ